MNTLHNLILRTPIAALCMALTPWIATSAQAGIAVVVGSNSPATALTAEQAQQIFLAKAATLPGGTKAVLIDHPEGATVREQFYSKVAGKNPAQMKALWSRLTFSGAAQPPTALASDADVKKAVAADPGAIGYIDSSTVDATVKVLLNVD